MKAATAVRVAGTVVRVAGTVVRGVRVDREAAVRVVPEAGHAASASISGRKRFASSASRRWTSSTTNARTFFPSSCRNAGRFCRDG